MIYITFNQLPKPNCTYSEFINRYTSFILNDLKSAYPSLELNDQMLISDVFRQIFEKTGKGFIFIIDERDYIFNKRLFSNDDKKAF